MSHRRIEQAIKKGRQWAEQRLKVAGMQVTPEMVEHAAQDTFPHRGQQYLFMTAAMEVLLEKETVPAKSA